MHECRTCLCATAGRHFGDSASVFNSKGESDSNQALSVGVGKRWWLYVTFFGARSNAPSRAFGISSSSARLLSLEVSRSEHSVCRRTNPDRWLRRANGLDRVVGSRLKKSP